MDVLELMKRKEGYCSGHENAPKEVMLRAKKLCWAYNRTGPEEGEERQRILRQLLGTCHELTFIEPNFRCGYGCNIHTHGLTMINYNCVILDTSPVEIGANAFLAPGVCLACSGHSIDSEQRGQGIGTSKPITLGENVWIGAHAVVLGGVTIGSGSVIAAGSVVTRDIPPGVVAAGVPCRVLRPVGPEDRIPPEQILF